MVEQRQRVNVLAVPPLARPLVGDEVVCLSGGPVGRVVAVFDTTFEVLTSSETLLLPMECVYHQQMNRTTLVCNRSGLEKYVLGGSAR